MTSTRAIKLYRSLLKAHRKHLPFEMRAIGDTYVRSEFRLHKNAKVEHLEGFFSEWEKYLDHLLRTARAKESLRMDHGDNSKTGKSDSVFQYGSDLPSNLELSEEQRVQLQKLKDETDKYGQGSGF